MNSGHIIDSGGVVLFSISNLKKNTGYNKDQSQLKKSLAKQCKTETKKMNFSINIDHRLKIIKYNHSGLISAENIEEAWRELLKIKEFTQLHYNLFSDYRNGVFQIPRKSLPEIIEFMRKIEPVVKGKKQALIVDEPNSVAASILFKNKVNEEIGFIVKVFSTEESALQWLSF